MTRPPRPDKPSRPAGKRPPRGRSERSGDETRRGGGHEYERPDGPAAGPADERSGARQARAKAQGPEERIAKVLARAGLCSRREAEAWIADGRVAVNGKVLASPAVTVGPADAVTVDGQPLPDRERTRLWLFHKPRGVVTTNRDPEGRSTVFHRLPDDLPRVLTVGRLDINTEGLLLLTNDGGLARVLELPDTGWLRRYRVRAHGKIDQAALDALQEGIVIEGMIYGAIEATLDRVQGSNCWLTLGLREGKNREVKKVLEHLGLSVTRLIRVSYGPFQLGDLREGTVKEVRGRTLKDQLGSRLARQAKADFDTPLAETRPPEPEAGKRPAAKPGKGGGKARPGKRPAERETNRPQGKRPNRSKSPGDKQERSAGNRDQSGDRPNRGPKRGTKRGPAGGRTRKPGGGNADRRR